MTNPHLGSDAKAFLDSIIPDTTKLHILGQQEAMRIELTQILRDARKAAGLSHKEIADKVAHNVNWVKKAEDCNDVHTWDEFIAYMYALDANFEITVSLPNGQTIKLDSEKIKKISA